MNMKLSALLLGAAVVLGSGCGAELHAEDADAAYTRVISERAQRVLEPIGIDDPATLLRATGIVMDFYRQLSTVQDASDAAISAVRAQALPEAARDAAIAAIRDGLEREQYRLNYVFTGQLLAFLDPAQMIAVKDGITYGVVPLTYRVYTELLPDLTADQRHFILSQLTEAREYALTAGSSHRRHQVFGRAKGRINNMLSAAGMDMKQAEADMRARAAN